LSIVGRDPVGEQLAPEDLIARLRAPSKQPEEQKISQTEQVIDLH